MASVPSEARVVCARTKPSIRPRSIDTDCAYAVERAGRWVEPRRIGAGATQAGCPTRLGSWQA